MVVMHAGAIARNKGNNSLYDILKNNILLYHYWKIEGGGNFIVFLYNRFRLYMLRN